MGDSAGLSIPEKSRPANTPAGVCCGDGDRTGRLLRSGEGWIGLNAWTLLVLRLVLRLLPDGVRAGLPMDPRPRSVMFW